MERTPHPHPRFRPKRTRELRAGLRGRTRCGCEQEEALGRTLLTFIRGCKVFPSGPEAFRGLGTGKSKPRASEIGSALWEKRSLSPRVINSFAKRFLL